MGLTKAEANKRRRPQRRGWKPSPDLHYDNGTDKPYLGLVANRKPQTLRTPTAPTNNPEIKAKLLEAWTYGANNMQAAAYAGITPRMCSNILEADPTLLERKEAARAKPNLIAKMNIYNRLARGDTKVSQWQLERTDPDYSLKTDSRVLTMTLADAILQVNAANSAPVERSDAEATDVSEESEDAADAIIEA